MHTSISAVEQQWIRYGPMCGRRIVRSLLLHSLLLHNTYVCDEIPRAAELHRLCPSAVAAGEVTQIGVQPYGDRRR